MALIAEEEETCPLCGHPISVCRDRKTAGTWTVVQETCFPSQVAEVQQENNSKAHVRGAVISTRRT